MFTNHNASHHDIGYSVRMEVLRFVVFTETHPYAVQVDLEIFENHTSKTKYPSTAILPSSVSLNV